MQHTLRQSLSHSKFSTPLTDSPQVLSFANVVGKVCIKNLISSLTNKGAVLKEVPHCIIRSDEKKLKQLKRCLRSYWRDLHVSSGCVCMDEGAITNALKQALKEDDQTCHPCSWVMLCMTQHCWWPNMNRDLIFRAIECEPCAEIDKNLRSVISAIQFQPHKPCIVPNQEIQIDFAGPNNNEKDHEIYIKTDFAGPINNEKIMKFPC